jgi:hypothetical protein
MSFAGRLITKANSEWEFFGKDEGSSDKFVKVGGGKKRKETVRPYEDRIADYWLSISEAEYKRLMKAYKPSSGRLDGTLNIAWSAAFISYCMQIAGAGLEFPYSPGHATWIVKSIKNRNANKLGAPLVGYRPGEKVVAVGDLFGNPREDGIDYDNAPSKGWFLSHSDIVVEIDIDARKAFTIGGNVGQSVGRKTFALDSSGKLKANSSVMVHIQSNITGTVAASGAAHPVAVNVG